MIKLFKTKPKEILNPSKDFQDFMTNYFTGHPMLRGRGEEDITVWERLKDDELVTAKDLIIDELDKTTETAYMRAAGIFRDKRAIKKLKRIVRKVTAKRYCYERLYAAKVLFDWVGYSKYLKLLDDTLHIGGQWTKINLDYWIKGLNRTDALKYVFLLLRDDDSFVRWNAYGALKNYFNKGGQEFEETKYYTGDEVYVNDKLFEDRLEELKHKIQSW